MQRHKRRAYLTEDQKNRFKEACDQFESELHLLFRDLEAFGAGYRSLLEVKNAIAVAQVTLDMKTNEATWADPARTP